MLRAHLISFIVAGTLLATPALAQDEGQAGAQDVEQNTQALSTGDAVVSEAVTPSLDEEAPHEELAASKAPASSDDAHSGERTDKPLAQATLLTHDQWNRAILTGIGGTLMGGIFSAAGTRILWEESGNCDSTRENRDCSFSPLWGAMVISPAWSAGMVHLRARNEGYRGRVLVAAAAGMVAQVGTWMLVYNWEFETTQQPSRGILPSVVAPFVGTAVVVGVYGGTANLLALRHALIHAQKAPTRRFTLDSIAPTFRPPTRGETAGTYALQVQGRF